MGYEISKELVEELTIGEVTTNTAFLHDWLKNRQFNVAEIEQYFQMMKDRHKINLTLVTHGSKNILPQEEWSVLFQKKLIHGISILSNKKRTQYLTSIAILRPGQPCFCNNKIVDADGEVLGCIGVL